MRNFYFLSFAIVIILGCASSKGSKSKTKYGDNVVLTDGNFKTAPIKNPSVLQAKYAEILHVPADSVTNVKLYSFIDDWLGSPYLWGGETKSGIDCSAFVRTLLDEVYNIKLPRTSVDQFFNQRIEKFKSTKYLQEGDLVFFAIAQDKIISHVGLYLKNNRFVNASSKGVSIANLQDPYWKPKIMAAGRVKVAPLTGSGGSR